MGICRKGITQSNFSQKSKSRAAVPFGETLRPCPRLPRKLFGFSFLPLREEVFLPQLDQGPLLHHAVEHQGALFRLDVKEVYDILPVGEARPGQILQDGLPVPGR